MRRTRSAGWSGGCSGSDTTCTLELYVDATVSAAFTPLAADRCASPTDADCLRAVYLGAPDDYAQVQDILAELIIQPNADGRYVVERGQQVTVVTAAPLPAGYTRFYLHLEPSERILPTSFEQLIPPAGTTFTFTSSSFEAAADELRYDLRAAKPPLRPGLKPQPGDTIIILRFAITNPPPALDPTLLVDAMDAPALTPGRYEFSLNPGQFPPLAISIPTSAHHVKWRGTIVNFNGVSLCLSEVANDTFLCLEVRDGTETSRHIGSNAPTHDGVTIEDVFDYIAASATVFRLASCESGTSVSDPAANAELVGDCERLIRLRDVLAGSAALNWDVRTAITGWQGVTISGTPQRVTELNLASLGLNGELSGLLGELDALTELRLNANALTGRIPSKLTTLTNLTHLYLAGNSFAGCLPPDLRDVANHDLSSLSLTDCGAPNDISYGEHTLTAGTYEFALVDDGPAVMFDVPAGLNLEIVGIVLSESEDGDSTIGLILRNTSEQSWICVDLEAAEECYRKIVSTIQPGTADIAALFDRLAESLWMDSSP